MLHRGFTLSANISILYPDLPYAERFEAARTAGFDRVESWWPFAVPVPGQDEVDEFVAGLRRTELRLTALNFWAGDMPAGERGVAARPGRAHELEANLPAVVEIARRTECRFFNVLYGQRDETVPLADQHAIGAASLRACARGVAEFGGTILVEPLATAFNGGYLLESPGDADRVIAAVGEPNVRLLFDTFHLGSNGIDIVAAARDHAGRIGHVQVADAPGRGGPGSGKLPLNAALDALREGGYDGLVGCEHVIAADDTDPFAWVSSR